MNKSFSVDQVRRRVSELHEKSGHRQTEAGCCKNKKCHYSYEDALAALGSADVSHVTVKLPGIYSRIQALNFGESFPELVKRLGELYRKAIASPHKVSVRLDMADYKDSHLAMRVFKETLSKPEFESCEAEIVIPAYWHDALDFQGELLEFAEKRVAKGGAPLKMRLTEGANRGMETALSSLKGWPDPVYATGSEVDASYMNILDRALLPASTAAVKVSVATHNPFLIAYAHLAAEANGTASDVTFGMPDFPKNESSDKQFAEAMAIKDKLPHGPVRTQDRRKPYPGVSPAAGTFANEPDTDFDLEANQRWAEEIAGKWKRSEKDAPLQIPLQIGAREVTTADKVAYKDRCQDDRVTVFEMSRAGVEDTKKIVAIAAEDPAGWRKTSLEERRKILYKAADNLAELRGDIIGCMCAVTSKTITEGDVEVSEAIDFTRFYPTTMREFEDLKGVKVSPKGTVLVISPWNFPCAIPCGGVVVALATGNTVILKPATVAAPVAWTFAKAFWDAGVPREALQVVITDRPSLTILNTAPQIRHIILTGGTDTARDIAAINPSTPLSAETGGKNVMILTASGDSDKAIVNAVASAFGNAGQKCSACSILMVEASIYDDPSFRAKLRDAALNLKTGSVWNIGNFVGPMITNRNDKLLEAIGELQPGEEWLVEPRFLDEKKYMLAPTVKWGVRPENFSFRNELFGPMLSVVRVRDLHEAVDLANSLEYGLTSGLQSLDKGEIAYWKDNLEAGNLYINRGTTGAIVNRQPFGGMKLSAFGGGIKAGGPNYVSCFVNIVDRSDADDAPGAIEANYAAAWDREFANPRDVNHIYGEQNIFRYLPLRAMILRVMPGDSTRDVKRICLAARTSGTPLDVSVDPADKRAAEFKGLCRELFVENDAAFEARIPVYDRIRTCSTSIPASYYGTAAKHDKYIAAEPAVSEGRVEILHYIKEQSIAHEYHRSGNFTEIPPLR